MAKEYDVCTELLTMTSEILRNYDKAITGDVFKVKRQVMFRCPKTDELVPESKCAKCAHNFGNISDNYIYCLPKDKKNKGKRGEKK